MTCLALWPLVKKVWTVTSLFPAQKENLLVPDNWSGLVFVPWFPWIKTVTMGREPGISRRSYEHKPGYFERKREENKTSCSIHCLLLRFSKTCEFQSSKANWRLRFSLPSIILADLSGNRNLLQQVQKVMACDWWLVNFRSVLCVSVFQGLLLVIVVMIDGSEKCNCEGGCVFEKHSK